LLNQQCRQERWNFRANTVKNTFPSCNIYAINRYIYT
jgi:hypothetical protein